MSFIMLHLCLHLVRILYIATDGKSPTAKLLVPKCLDMADVITIWRFFRKSWCYMDAYQCITFTNFNSISLTYNDRKGLNPQQAAFSTKIYKQHHHVGTIADVQEAMWLQEVCNMALANL